MSDHPYSVAWDVDDEYVSLTIAGEDEPGIAVRFTHAAWAEYIQVVGRAIVSGERPA